MNHTSKECVLQLVIPDSLVPGTEVCAALTASEGSSNLICSGLILEVWREGVLVALPVQGSVYYRNQLTQLKYLTQEVSLQSIHLSF